ncbi:urea carboxylase-associated protein [Nostoc linckia z15]|nr:urea carboxylase-associated protein [Nostoc linckia z15]
MTDHNIISPRSGTSFILKKGQRLKVIDLEGEQVSDLICYNLHDTKEYLSSGRTIDYAETAFLTAGHEFYSNRSNIMFRLLQDTVGKHDFLLTPCSADTFRIIYGDKQPHRGCFGNLCEALSPYGITPDEIPVTFNIFMNVSLDPVSGKIGVHPPKSGAGDHIIIEAEMDLIVGLTACSAPQSNNGSFKPIGFALQ